MAYDISDKEFTMFQKLIYDRTGIYLSENKRLLMLTRLTKRLRALNLATLQDYYTHILESDNGTEELIHMINRITTNKTDFFRENHHFDFLHLSVFPQLEEKKQKKIRIWSAGCSTGEEPYSIAMTILDYFQEKPGYDIKILATDLDTDVLDHGKQGIYLKEKTAPIPNQYKMRFTKNGPSGKIEMKPELKNIIDFKRLNLKNIVLGHNPFKYGFQIIFCRNVIIYFKREDRTTLVSKYHNILRPGGFLFLGHSESLIAQEVGFYLVGNTMYKKD